jgi:hypothetical protein
MFPMLTDRKLSSFLALPLLVSTLLLAGCPVALIGGGAVVGASTVAYIKGELRVELEHNSTDVYNASVATLQQQRFKIVNREVKRSDLPEVADDGSPRAVKPTDTMLIEEGIIHAETSNQDDVTVTVERVSTTNSRLKIRVGAFGDEAISNQLLKLIEERLN